MLSKRATDIGWNTDDDSSLVDYILKKPTATSSPKYMKNGRLESSPDAEERVMSSRKKALALGQFKFLSQDGDFLEESCEFVEAKAKANSTYIRYFNKPYGFKRSNFPKTRYTSRKCTLPFICARFHVIWIDAAAGGEMRRDKLVKLYDFDSIYRHEIDCEDEGPLSPWFGLVDPRKFRTEDGQIHFDANMFWTVALLYKHLGTCGVEQWDKEILAMKRTYSMNVDDGNNNFVLPFQGRKQEGATPLVETVGTAGNDGEIGQRYSGCVTEWKGTYGFLSTTVLNKKVFLHVNDIVLGNPNELTAGISVNFELHLNAERNGYKATEAKAFC